MIEKEFTIKEPIPSLFVRIFASIVFTLFIAYAIYLIKEKYLVQKINPMALIFFVVLILLFVLTITIPKIARHIIHINFNELKIKHEFDLGFYTYKESWQNLNELEYLSVYKVNREFRANLWYETNNIVNLFVLADKDKAIENAFIIADNLGIDLLDATVKGRHKWINKSVYKETGEITYLD